MVSEHGIKLAIHLITKHFGTVVSKVCETLIRKGALTLEQLIRFTQLQKEQVRNSLLVLIQHNCAQPFILENQDGIKTHTTQYLALFDNILHRPRFPKFMEIVKHQLDDELCVVVLEGLLRNGRLNLKQIADNASEGKQNPVTVRESLCKLLAVRYVERCPAPEPVVYPVVEETTIKKRGAKFAKIFQPPLTIEQRVLEASVPGEAIRFSLAADTTGFNADRETNSDDIPMTTSVEENVFKEELIPWRANFEEFMRILRHKAMIENVRTRLDDAAATVLSAILEATRTAEKNVKVQNSVPLSLETIFTELVKTETGRTMTIDRVKATLVQLGCPSRVSDDSYTIDLNNIIELARNEEVESIVLKRYGTDAYRMFRLLSKANRFLETDQIAESTLVEKKEAPKLLYRLWKDNYLHMEKLQVMAAKQSRFILWKVDKPLLWEYVLDEMYHAALNLNLRMDFELEKDDEVLFRVSKDKREGSKTLKTKHNRLQNVYYLLGSSLMNLDDALMLFHDF
ncbi:hypothetical protein RIF29_18791 [Crotalaria pallida]|uniref:DNA-directed RNA polymerase III subunit RPC3 n=1 Tax=Crotalaria pallida TaxID=3830 RepID=A0AAN9F0K5_CROPI